MATLYAAATQYLTSNWCNADDGVQDTAPGASDDLVVSATCDWLVLDGHLEFSTLTINDSTVSNTVAVALTGDVELGHDNATLNTLHPITVNGDLTYTAGAVTVFRVFHAGTSNVVWDKGGDPITFYALASGATVTRTADCYAAAATVPAGTTLTGNNLLVLVPTADDYLSVAGTVSQGAVRLRGTADRSNSYDVDLSGVDVQVFLSNDTWSFTGTFKAASVGTGGTWSQGNGLYGALDLQGGGAVGAVQLGWSGGDRPGRLTLRNGRYTMTSLVKGKAGSDNRFALYNADVVLSGALNGADVTVDAAQAGRIIGGTVSNVSIDGATKRIVAWGCKDGGSNGLGVEFAPRVLGVGV
jgi:hypothetical protein